MTPIETFFTPPSPASLFVEKCEWISTKFRLDLEEEDEAYQAASMVFHATGDIEKAGHAFLEKVKQMRVPILSIMKERN